MINIIVGYILALEINNGGKLRHKVNLEGSGFNSVAVLLEPETDTLFCGTYGEMRAFKAESMKEIWKSNLPDMGHCLAQSLSFHEVC